MRRTSNSSRGFTFIEMMISAAIGLAMVAAAAQLYSKALTVNLVTSQRAQLQQDFRAAANLLQRDISMAGAGALGQQGLSTSAVGLPASTGTLPVYPCTALTTCDYVNSLPVTYPVNPTGSTIPYLYSIIPGYDLGITVNAAQGPTDIITVVSADPTISLNCYSGTMNSAGTAVTFQLPTTLPSTCVLPTSVVTPAPLNAAAPVGLQIGDMVLFGSNAVGVVTGTVTTCAPSSVAYSACYLVPFAGPGEDPGHVNQPAATSGSLGQYKSAATPSAVRLQMVTYYLAIPPSTGLPTLMRIQNGQVPAPVAENVVYLKFSYDVNNGGTIETNQTSLPTGTTPAMITKVNILHMSMRSQGRDGWSKSALAQYGGYEGFDLQTSIAARNLTSQQEYPMSCSTPPCY
ncbi:MAG: prepilin-type N-terminal cleavage/methylation domain-containing protein [Candidatus Sulfotelmatobacter sp.]